MTLTLPWPPSVNSYWTRTSHGGLMLTKKAREFRANVLACALEQKAIRLAGHRLIVQIDAYPPDRRRRDLDNLQKGLLDSLEHARVIDDDGNIDVLTISRREPSKPGRVVVTVSVML